MVAYSLVYFLEVFYDYPRICMYLPEFYVSILMEYASRNQTKSQEALLRVLYRRCRAVEDGGQGGIGLYPSPLQILTD